MTTTLLPPVTPDVVTTPEPAWCRHEQCVPDRADGSVFHMSAPEDVPTDGGTGLLDLALCRIDDEDDGTGETTVSLNAGPGGGKSVELTAAQALHLSELLRGYALRAAGPAGVEMPVDRVRLGDEIQVADGWEVAEVVMVDGWCCGTGPKPGHRHQVQVATDAHSDDDQAHEYAQGDAVRVRAVGS